MTGHLEGRVALVTGAAGEGIGQATARRLAKAGATVIVTDSHEGRTREVSARLADELGTERVRGEVLDIRDRRAIDDVVRRTASAVGPVDVLVNNAAINVLSPIHDMSPEEWDETLAVDLSAPWYLCRAVRTVLGRARAAANSKKSSTRG